MKRFAIKAMVFLSPFTLIFLLYILTDPLKKIWDYDVYAFDYIMLNKGDVSTNTFIKKRNIYKYDSFIFGSSRTCATSSKEWKKYIGRNNVPFSYGSWEEPLKGIYRKIVLLDSFNTHINNAIITIDVDKTFVNNEIHPLNSDHYLISGKSKFEYYKSDFISYIRNPRLIITSIDYKLFKKQRSYMSEFVDPKYGGLDSVDCDWRLKSEKLIMDDSVTYYNRCRHKFYQRSATQIYSNRQIDKEKEFDLIKINTILRRHKTNLKIIISPLYDQIKINQQDLALLQKIFGENKVFDYSGINNITQNIFNYGEDMYHYRSRTGNMLLREIYRNDMNISE